MSNEITNEFAVELSDSELDTVAGGFSLVIDNGQTLTNDSVSKFSQKDLLVAGGTFAGPGGAGNTFSVAAREIKSFSNQNLGVGN
ncbi:hypothetical protein NIES4101_52690 [Calothrix sp. NIES-4101]|nr:hypothetical protein NIES4101_52690 [Calothrix sp. NIES-4101]